MSENAQIALIVIVGVVILGGVALFILRGKIGSASLKVSKKGGEMNLKTHQPARSTVCGNKITGNGNALKSRNGSGVEKNTVEGDGNKLENE